MTEELYARAALLIRGADGLLIGAGSGLGVDSGLPDFRGNEGFWRAYPAFRSRGLSFVAMANPRWFDSDPAQAWGFYGHRLNLYRATVPHRGFAILKSFGELCPLRSFVFTSNVDGQFQAADFENNRIVECHGSIHFLQCTKPCTGVIWGADSVNLAIDLKECRAVGPLPTCPRCGRVARPNVLMFGDETWIADRTAAQLDRYARWMDGMKGKRLVAIECGAGTAVPTVRQECGFRTDQRIRINPREAVEGPGISLRASALTALERLAETLDLELGPNLLPRSR